MGWAGTSEEIYHGQTCQGNISNGMQSVSLWSHPFDVILGYPQQSYSLSLLQTGLDIERDANGQVNNKDGTLLFFPAKSIVFLSTKMSVVATTRILGPFYSTRIFGASHGQFVLQGSGFENARQHVLIDMWLLMFAKTPGKMLKWMLIIVNTDWADVYSIWTKWKASLPRREKRKWICNVQTLFWPSTTEEKTGQGIWWLVTN